MGGEVRPASWLSTPMIKDELRALLDELAPDKRWSKSAKLKDLIEFTLQRFPEDTADASQRRALELAHVIHDSERR